MEGNPRHIRRGGALLAGVSLAIVAGAVAFAGGATHAGTTIRDAGGVVGWARLTEDAGGTIHVNVHVKGMSPGRHGIHIHTVGSCADSFAAAGAHLNLGGQFHGLDNTLGQPHAGDLPNLVVNGAGIGVLAATTDRASLGANILDADGSALVIHADLDNQVDQPIGLSGARIACGVITAD